MTDHAVVAMIDDEIKRTRCVSCDTEHEYKQGRVPPQRRKKASPALFSQVLDGMNPPARPAQPADGVDEVALPGEPPLPAEETLEPPWTERPAMAAVPAAATTAAATPATNVEPPEPAPLTDDDFENGPVRRPLIRAQLPRLEGQPPPTRTLPDFTVRQAKNGRGGGSNRPPGGGQRHAGGRRQQNDLQGAGGPPRFGGQRPQGQGRGGDRSQGAGGWSGNRPDRGRGGRGRGGKKPR